MPGIDYWIKIKAREWLYFPFAQGSDIPSWAPQELNLMNRSTVFLPYTFVLGDELAVDFGGLGIWKWEGSAWSQRTPGDPVNMVRLLMLIVSYSQTWFPL